MKCGEEMKKFNTRNGAESLVVVKYRLRYNLMIFNAQWQDGTSNFLMQNISKFFR